MTENKNDIVAIEEYSVPQIDNTNLECGNVEIAVVEESYFIEIVTEDNEETIALRRTIGTDPDCNSMSLENYNSDPMAESVSFYNNNNVVSASIESQTIFLYGKYCYF